MKDFAGKVAVITGAGSGIGREYALRGASLGMKLVLADIECAALERTASMLRENGAQVIAMQCDVSRAGDVQSLALAAMSAFGEIHLLFNNAGVGSGGLLWENSEADWRWMLGVNLWGVIHAIRIFTPLMLETARTDAGYCGHIINTASMAGLVNPPAMGVYNASKHAVVSLSETLHHDLGLVDARIGVTLVCPYFVPTGINSSRRNFPSDAQPAAGMAPEPTAAQNAAQEIMEMAMAAGKVSAACVAESAFDAIRNGEFYVFSHPATLESVQQRMENIVSGRSPANPYEDFPSIQKILKARVNAKLDG